MRKILLGTLIRMIPISYIRNLGSRSSRIILFALVIIFAAIFSLVFFQLQKFPLRNFGGSYQFVPAVGGFSPFGIRVLYPNKVYINNDAKVEVYPDRPGYAFEYQLMSESFEIIPKEPTQDNIFLITAKHAGSKNILVRFRLTRPKLPPDEEERMYEEIIETLKQLAKTNTDTKKSEEKQSYDTGTKKSINTHWEGSKVLTIEVLSSPTIFGLSEKTLNEIKTISGIFGLPSFLLLLINLYVKRKNKRPKKKEESKKIILP